MPETQPHMGKYIYCIVRAGEPRQFSALGIGERGDIVHTVHFENLAAVVSDSPVVEYENSRRNMMAHTLVLEEVMKGLTILPVRFSTVAPSARTIEEQVLKRRFGELNGLLNEMDGRVEMGLKAIWYEAIVFEEIVREDSTIQRLRDKLIGRPAEETYYERIRLGEMIDSAMWKKRDQEAERILDRLCPLAGRTETNKVITDRMVLNAAFLIDRKREVEFDRAVEQLDADMGKRLMFKYVGPVPPYNFVNIVVYWDA
ncbi:MAG: GvpL/GvpF family gas vesicle protein [Anaerolineae bacterium]|nr:GvpL/GvpF family gas vesicle protein [Anaerolineae bacterium]